MTDFSADVRLAAEGDTSAFARLYELVYKDLYHIALYSLRSTHDACDAVSDTVLDAFEAIGSLRQPEAFRSWIMRILSAKIKQRQREYFTETQDIDGLPPEDAPETDFSFEDIELRDAVDRLDPQSRLILSMSVLGGYTSSEIAEVCGSSPSTVRSRLTRIRRTLRLELSEKRRDDT
ncbi:MAG: sigma-70 family RNA polymerase sigma factor [Ruminococcus sp.]|nr:sigma-70 family RNA polymerase sigma factor [Ruminococcus sp.]